MAKFQTMNDVEAAYDHGLIDKGNGLHECPVCAKSYKSKGHGERHVQERNCADMKALFSGTVTEINGFHAYKDVISELTEYNNVTFGAFKKSNMYAPVMRFVVFLNYHEMSEHLLSYANWIIASNESVRYPNQVWSYGIEPSTLHDYKLFIHKTDLTDSDQFDKWFSDNVDDIDNPELVLVRGIERAKVSLKYIAENDGVLSGMIENLPTDYFKRVESIAEEIT